VIRVLEYVALALYSELRMRRAAHAKQPTSRDLPTVRVLQSAGSTARYPPRTVRRPH
jgi:hypothetical protein